MKISVLPLVFIFSAVFAMAASSLQHEVSSKVRTKEFSLKKQVMLKGYDVVSYQLPNGPEKGNASYQVEYKGVVYYFVNTANKNTFLADPERYEPLYGGWCAYAMLEGDKTKANPESFKVVDGRLLVFYDGLWGDTLELWNEMLTAEMTDQTLIEKADARWESILR